MIYIYTVCVCIYIIHGIGIMPATVMIEAERLGCLVLELGGHKTDLIVA